MKYFVDEGSVTRYVLRLDPGDLVLESIQYLIDKEKIMNGTVVSGIGTLSHATLHMVTTTGYPPVETYPHWENKPLELCSIDGIIADGVPHLHTVISDQNMAYGGHLESGCVTLYLGEIVIEKWNNLKLKRVRNEKNILELEER